jgi:predicted metal-binding protein
LRNFSDEFGNFRSSQTAAKYIAFIQIGGCLSRRIQKTFLNQQVAENSEPYIFFVQAKACEWTVMGLKLTAA